MSDPTPPPDPKVDLCDVAAISNIDTARMALRWALERISVVEKERGKVDEELKRLREEAVALRGSSLARDEEARQRESYYAKMEELLSLRLSGKLDVASLVQQQADVSRLQEHLIQKEAELQRAYDSKTQNLELERQKASADAQRFALEESQKAEEALRNTRQTLEREHASRLAALREQEARLSREADDLGQRRARFEEFYAKQRTELDKDIQRFRTEVDDEVKFRVQNTEQLLAQRHTVMENSWIKEKALLTQELESLRAQLQRQLPELISLQSSLGQSHEELERLRPAHRGLQEEVKEWRKKALQLQNGLLDLEKRMAVAREEEQAAVHGKAEAEKDLRRMAQAWAEERGQLLARAQEAEGRQITERQQLEEAMQKERILLQAEISRERQSLERRHQEAAELLAKTAAREQSLLGEVSRLAAAEKQAETQGREHQARLAALQNERDEERRSWLEKVSAATAALESSEKASADARAESEARHAQAIFELQSKHQDGLASLKLDYEERIKALEGQAHDEKQQLSAALAALQGEHQQRLDSMRQEQALRVAELEKSLAESELARQAELRRLQSQWEEERRRWAELEHQRELSRRKQDEEADWTRAQAAAELEDKHQEVLAALKREHARHVESLNQAWDGERDSRQAAVSRLQEQWESERLAWERESAAMRAALEAAERKSVDARSGLETRQIEAITDLQARHRESLEALKAQYEARAEEREREAARARDEAGLRLKDLEARQAQEQAALELKHREMVAELRQEKARRVSALEKALSEAELNHQGALRHLQEQWDAERRHWAEQVTKVSGRFESSEKVSIDRQNEIEERHLQAMMELHAKHQEGLATLKKQYELRLDALEKSLSGSEAAHRQALDEIQMLRDLARSGEKDWAVKFAEIERRLYAEHGAQMVEKERAAAGEIGRLNERVKELEARLASSIGTVKEQYEARLKERESAHDQEREALSGRLRDLEGRLAAFASPDAVKELVAAHEAQRRALEDRLKEAQAAALALETRRAKEIAELQAAHGRELEALRRSQAERGQSDRAAGGDAQAQREALASRVKELEGELSALTGELAALRQSRPEGPAASSAQAQEAQVLNRELRARMEALEDRRATLDRKEKELAQQAKAFGELVRKYREKKA